MWSPMTRRSSDSDFMMCRTLGHAWDPIPADRMPPLGDAFWLRCVRCSTERHDAVWWGTGELIGRRYVYPDGYRNAFDEMFDVAPTRQDYRRLLFAEHLQRVRHLRAVRRAG
jgi:hypothetical protein